MILASRVALQIQDVAEQGVMFVGFLQQPGGGPCFMGNWDPDDLSSLHSSPSPIHRQPRSASTSPTDPPRNAEGVGNGEPLVPGDPESSPLRHAVEWCRGGVPAEAAANQFCDPTHQNGQCEEEPLNFSDQGERSSSSDSCLGSPDMNHKCDRKSGPTCTTGEGRAKTHNNNDDKSSAQDRK